MKTQDELIKENNLNIIFSFLDDYDREESSLKLGTSIPTLQRWISKRDFPHHVLIMVDLYFENNQLEKKLDYQKMKLFEAKQVVFDFLTASSDLKSLVSE